MLKKKLVALLVAAVMVLPSITAFGATTTAGPTQDPLVTLRQVYQAKLLVQKMADPAIYTADSWTAFLDAMAQAKVMIPNILGTTQAQATAMIATLQALPVLKTSPPEPDDTITTIGGLWRLIQTTSAQGLVTSQDYYRDDRIVLHQALVSGAALVAQYVRYRDYLADSRANPDWMNDKGVWSNPDPVWVAYGSPQPVLISQVEAAAQRIINALNELLNEPVIPRVTEWNNLRSYIILINSLYEQEDYTAASWNVLQTALSNATAVAQSISSLPSAFVNAYIAIANAVDGLIPLQPIIGEDAGIAYYPLS